MEKGVERIDYVVHRNSKSGAAEAGGREVNCPPDFASIVMKTKVKITITLCPPD